MRNDALTGTLNKKTAETTQRSMNFLLTLKPLFFRYETVVLKKKVKEIERDK